MTGFFDSVLEAFRVTGAQLVAIGPRFLGSAATLTIGWWLARGARRAVVWLLRALRIETAAERSGVEAFLLRGGVRFTAVTLIANVIYWALLLVVVLATFNLLGLRAPEAWLPQVAEYLPNLFVALALLLFGTTLARFVGATTHAYLDNIGAPNARGLGVVARVAVLAFVGFLSLGQLRIGGDVVLVMFQFAFGACCLAFGLAFGLGGRRWAAAVLERLWSGR
jgi:hypothetical protein